MKKEKDIKKLLENKEIEKEKLLLFILEDGEEQAIAESISLAKKLNRDNFMKLVEAFNCADEKIRNSFFKEIILCPEIYFPYKEIIIEKINQNEYFMKSEILDAIEESKKMHWAILRNFEEKKFSKEFFNNIIKNHIALIEKYVQDYINGNIKKAVWLFSYYGKENKFDEILLKLLKEHSTIETIAIIERILKKDIPKENIKELRKIKYAIERQVKGRGQNFLEEDEIAKIYRAWMTPYHSYNDTFMIIMNYLPNTDQFIYFAIIIHNLILKDADLNVVQRGDHKRVIKRIKERFSGPYKNIFEIDPSFALHYINLIIKNHKKRNIGLPRVITQYLPALLVKYNKNKKNPLAKIYGKDSSLLYQTHYSYLFKDKLFLQWCMNPAIITSVDEKLIQLDQDSHILTMRREQKEELIKEIIDDLLNKYWTNKRLKFLAFKLLVNSYYYYKSGKDFLSRLCYDAYKEILDMNIKPSQKNFLILFFIHSFILIKNIERAELMKKEILTPEEAAKLLFFNYEAINNIDK